VQNQIEPVLLNFLAPLGQKGEEITTTIIGFVDNIRVGVLGAVGLGFLLYTVVSLIQKVERTFNYTWRVSQHRPLAERFSDYLSVLMIGPVLVFSALGATASIMSTTLVMEMAHVPFLGWIIESAGKLVPYFFVISAFTFVYIYVPNTRVRLGSALVGAIVAGVLWQSIGWGFASFVVNSTKYAAIYSGFAILILFMIWLYLAWLILLIGASIAYYQQHPEQLHLRQAHTRCVGNRKRESIGLLSLCHLAKQHFDGTAPLSLKELATRVEASPDAVADSLDLLQRRHLVVTVKSKPEAFLPGRAPECITVKTVLDTLRGTEDQNLPITGTKDLRQAVAGVLSAVDQATSKTLNELTLRDLILNSTEVTGSALSLLDTDKQSNPDSRPASQAIKEETHR
ncbi:MAG: YihY/virulence factor BrkB family protein, partial [Gammaproteobacteria bacterium]|nr:YihY/virulence factor BrkB family protein [Gammaproteobacteria bacterium]